MRLHLVGPWFSHRFIPQKTITLLPVVDSVSVSLSHMVGLGFAFRPGRTKDHNKYGRNCLPAWHAMR